MSTSNSQSIKDRLLHELRDGLPWYRPNLVERVTHDLVENRLSVERALVSLEYSGAVVAHKGDRQHVKLSPEVLKPA